MEKIDDIFVCADCYLQHETGENENPDPRWSLGGFEHALRMHALGGRHIVSGDSDKDHEFSWARCDLCGSTLGGSRHNLAVLQEQSEPA